MSPASLLLWTALAATSAPPADAPPAPPADAFRPDPSWKQVGPTPHLWFDPVGKRLVMRARVVLREGALEHLLCLKGTKEHEAILSTEAIPRFILAGLILTEARPGHPVRFVPEFSPPAGTPIAIELRWQEGGQARTADARRWIMDERKKTPLDKDWVFAGSEVVPDPITKKPVLTADDGDLITVANFANAILDLPFASTADDANRGFIANTAQIPPRGTVVTMFLSPRAPSPPRTQKP